MVPMIVLGASMNNDVRDDIVREILSRPGVQDVVKLAESVRKTQVATQKVANINQNPLPTVRNATSSIGH